MILVTAGQMQQMDQQTIDTFGIPGRVLMENAGRGALDFLLETFAMEAECRVGVLAGPGNNGGDGFVMARYLLEKQIPVTVFLLAEKDKIKGDARANLSLYESLCARAGTRHLIDVPDSAALTRHRSALCHQDLYIDAILGTGLNSDVRGHFREVIDHLNQSASPVFSVDIPSGLHADTGKPLGLAVRADATATFAHAKAGLVLHPGSEYTGRLKVIDIGIPAHITRAQSPSLSVIEKEQVAPLFPPRPALGHKGSFGHLAVLAGSPGKTGAAALCANAAVRMGTGLVTLGTAQSIAPVLEPMVIEPMTRAVPDPEPGLLTDHSLDTALALLDGKASLALGPGIGTHDRTRSLVQKLLAEAELPMVIDADGLNCLARNPGCLASAKGDLILTPHPGEMARLTGKTTAQVQEDRVCAAGEFAERHGLILVLKGHQTLVSLPDGRTRICPTGNPGMASGGMGDVLTGMIAGLLAQGFTPEDAAVAGVYIHGLCGDVLAEKIGGFGYSAADLCAAIPGAIHQHLI